MVGSKATRKSRRVEILDKSMANADIPVDERNDAEYLALLVDALVSLYGICMIPVLDDTSRGAWVHALGELANAAAYAGINV